MINIFRQSIKLIVIVIVAGVPVVGSVAFAAKVSESKDVYIGVDLNGVNLELADESLAVANVRFKVGLVMFPDLIPTLSFESHIGFDLTNDTANINGSDAKLYLNNYAGLYIRASHEFGEVVSLYGLLGFAAAQLDGDAELLADDTETSLSFGVGVGFDMPFNLRGNVEAMQLVDGDVFDILMLSFGVSYDM